MAWLQNLAGRAEDLLNKIDKNAATVLSENGKTANIEIQIQDQLEVEPAADEPSAGNKSNTVALSVSRNSPLKDMPSEVNDTRDISDSGIVFSITSEISKTGNFVEEVVTERSLKNSTKSDRMSSSSSVHNSFVLDEESQLLHEKVAKLEFDNQDLNKQLLNMQHLYSEINNENSSLQFQIERLNEQVTEAQTEKEQYIARAQRILQEKEKLISLKDDSGASTEETESIFATYNEELKRGLEFQQTKNEELCQKNNQLTKEIQSLQMQHQIIQNGLQSTNQSLEQRLANERQFKSIAEEDCLQKNKELHLKIQDIAHLQDLVRAKADEINQLKDAVKQKANTNVNEDFESRIRTLTQTLMLKQSHLEAVTTERNALKLQLEKLENKHKTEMSQLHRTQTRIMNVDEFDDSIPLPRFIRISPFDAGVTRRVKRAYSTLDSISIKTGIVLRRYPVARVFVFSYVVLLHIWVFLILFWNAPSNR